MTLAALKGAMTRENVGLKSAPAEQAYLPQHENVGQGRVRAGENHQPQWRLRDLGRHLNRCIRSQAAFHAQLAQLRPQTRTVTLRSSGGGTWKPLLSQIPSFARPRQGRQLAGPATQTQATGCKSRDNQEKRRWFRCVIERDIQRYSSAIVGYKLIEDVEIHVALGSESKSVAERRKRGCRQPVVSIIDLETGGYSCLGLAQVERFQDLGSGPDVILEQHSSRCSRWAAADVGGAKGPIPGVPAEGGSPG